MKLLLSTCLGALLLASPALAQTGGSQARGGKQLHWQPWSDAAFKEARSEHRIVLLDLEAVWCHVMDANTYSDRSVCTSRVCSPPIFKAEDLPARVDRLSVL
jgi:uncharacterized protein YyaL (SSP411 family)